MSSYSYLVERQIKEHQQKARAAWEQMTATQDSDALMHIMEYEQNKAVVYAMSALLKEFDHL